MKIARLFLLLALAIVQNTARSGDEPLGRLFFTPQQRASLDRQRQLNPGFRTKAPETESSQTINGEIRRSDGRSTRWINGEASWNDTPRLPRVPVGDTYNPGTGEHQSLLGNGSIVIKPGSKPK